MQQTFIFSYGLFLVIGVILIVIVSVIFRGNSCQPVNGLYPGGFTKPVIALELAQSAESLKTILSDSKCRAQQSRDLYLDSFIFIPFYGLALAGLCLLSIRSQSSSVSKVGYVALALLIAGVISDYAENFAMWAAIRWQGEFTDAMADTIRHRSICKWLLVFGATALLSFFFVGIGRLGPIIAVCFVASFLISIYAMTVNYPAIEKVGLPVLIGLVLVIYLFLRSPGEVVASLAPT